MKPARDWQQFFDRLVHDLREPLRSIQSFSELLREIAAGQLGPDGDMAIDEILAGAGKMRVLIEGLSSYGWTLNQASGSDGDERNKAGSMQLAFDMATLQLDREIAACGATVTGENLQRA